MVRDILHLGIYQLRNSVGVIPSIADTVAAIAQSDFSNRFSYPHTFIYYSHRFFSTFRTHSLALRRKNCNNDG